MSERRCLFFAYSISNFAPPAAIKRCCFVELCDPLLTQNGTGAGRAGRKQRKIRRVNGGKSTKRSRNGSDLPLRQPTDQKAGGSNPSRRATPKPLQYNGFGVFLLPIGRFFGGISNALDTGSAYRPDFAFGRCLNGHRYWRRVELRCCGLPTPECPLCYTIGSSASWHSRALTA